MSSSKEDVTDEKGAKGKLLGNSMRKGTSEVDSERLARDRSKDQKKKNQKW